MRHSKLLRLRLLRVMCRRIRAANHATCMLAGRLIVILQRVEQRLLSPFQIFPLLRWERLQRHLDQPQRPVQRLPAVVLSCAMPVARYLEQPLAGVVALACDLQSVRAMSALHKYG